MGRDYLGSDEFFRDLHSLIEAWCDRRCLHALATLLPAYTSFNGLTDGWGELLAAMQALALSKNDLHPDEWETVANLRHAAENALDRR
jgi:hypothetical protein